MQSISNKCFVEYCLLDRQLALRYLGYKGQHVDDALLDEFERIAAECERRFAVRGTWRTFAIDNPELRLEGNSIKRFLKDSSHAVLMACTLGMDCERELNKSEAQGALKALMADACASALIESGADACQRAIRLQCGNAVNGAICGDKRFSPGYGDFPIERQHDFLDTLDASRNIGLFVTESHMLIPAKSITAIIPVRMF